MKILLIKYRNIGDVLLSSALIANLRHYFPSARIDFSLNKECENILHNNPNINNIYSYDRVKQSKLNFYHKFIDNFSFIKFVRRNDYDFVLNLTEGERGFFIALFSKARHKLSFKPKSLLIRSLGYNFSYAQDDGFMHAVDRDLQFLSFLSLENFKKEIQIFWSDKDEIIVNKFLSDKNIKKFVVVHPVARWKYKSWQDDRMAEVIDYLSTKLNYTVVMTSSSDLLEFNKLKTIKGLCQAEEIYIANKFTLNQFGYLTSQADLFFGVDTAPMHIAASNSTPVIALFGGSSPVTWGPWDNDIGSTYKDINGLQRNGRHYVISNNNREITYLNGNKRTKGMLEISTKEVFDVLEKFKCGT